MNRNRSLIVRLALLAAALAAGNFLCIALGFSSFEHAVDRSWFQCTALVAAYFSARERPVFSA